MIATPGMELASLRGFVGAAPRAGNKTVSCHEDTVLCEMSQLKRQSLLCSSYWRCLSHGCKSRRGVAKGWGGVIWGLFQDFQGSTGNKAPGHWRHSTANIL